jgi:hypothetical protein
MSISTNVLPPIDEVSDYVDEEIDLFEGAATVARVMNTTTDNGSAVDTNMGTSTDVTAAVTPSSLRKKPRQKRAPYVRRKTTIRAATSKSVDENTKTKKKKVACRWKRKICDYPIYDANHEKSKKFITEYFHYELPIGEDDKSTPLLLLSFDKGDLVTDHPNFPELIWKITSLINDPITKGAQFRLRRMLPTQWDNPLSNLVQTNTYVLVDKRVIPALRKASDASAYQGEPRYAYAITSAEDATLLPPELACVSPHDTTERIMTMDYGLYEQALNEYETPAAYCKFRFEDGFDLHHQQQQSSVENVVEQQIMQMLQEEEDKEEDAEEEDTEEVDTMTSSLSGSGHNAASSKNEEIVDMFKRGMLLLNDAFTALAHQQQH